MPRRAWTWYLLIALAGFAGPARGDFVISIGSPSIPQGGTGVVDVWLRSTASSSAPDLLNNLAFTLQITGPNELQFASVQDFSYLNGAPYVFAGDSLDQSTSSPGGSVLTSSYLNDTFVGVDATFSGNPVSLDSSSGSLLLATLTLSAAITNIGDSYAIGLVPASGDGSMNSSTAMYFDNVDFATGLETSAVSFTSAPGTVTIIAASVPEPSTIVSGLSAMLFLAGAYRTRRRTLALRR